MPKSKLSAFLSLLLVFVSGAVVGALAHRLYMVNTAYSGNGPVPPPHRPTPEEARKRITSDLQARLHLDDQQLAALNKIMDETNEAWQTMRRKINEEGRTLHDQQWEKFRASLRPDQQPIYDQWRTDRDNEMRKRREQDHKGPPRP